jgi:hypothetical protein
MQPKESKSYWHFYCSMSKSILRAVAGYCLITNTIGIAGWLFIVAEILGVVEEF